LFERGAKPRVENNTRFSTRTPSESSLEEYNNDMYKPSFEEFRKLSKKGNVIPVYKEINADLDTPVSSYLKIQKGDYGFLLESVEGREKLARYSFLGSDPCLIFESRGRDIRISYPGKKKTVRFKTARTPLDEIKLIMQDKKAVSVAGLPPFYGGLVGYMGYDTVRFFERLPDKNPDDLKLPDSVFMLTDTMMIFDHINHTIKIINNVFLPTKPVGAGLKPAPTIAQMKRLYEKAIKKIKEIEKDFKKPIYESVGTDFKPVPTKPKVSSNFTKTGFKAIVLRAKKYIKAGDIIQVVPSQRFKVKTAKPPFQIYRDLRSLNPSPYMYFLKLKGFYIAGSSPEMLVRCENGIIQTRPIAGTRPRGRNEQEDVKLEKELLADQKERAEHLMLVDLGRNDIGRVAKSGTVKVSEFMSIERYSHVMHLVSEVRGVLDRDKYSVYDVLQAAFPAGTVSGSPKVRAMEIIDELETLRRGPYAGCVGYFSFSHNMDTCITIRTVVIKGGAAYVQAGGGVVADSVPEKEYYETVNKAKALIEAIVGTE